MKNGADEGLEPLLGAEFPWVKLLDPGDNLGYGGGCNYGARHACGEWVAFLNSDMRVDRRWLGELLAAAARHPEVPCFGSAILSWNGRRIDFAGAAMNFYGVGFQPGHGAPISQLPAEDRPLLFSCGGATFVRRDVFLECGGFDEDFWAYYEDVDFGWRLWVLGHEVWLARSSVVYHHHHGSFRKVGQERTRLLYERNALLTVIKNYDDENLRRILPVAMLLAAKRAFLATGVDAGEFRIGRRPPHTVARAAGPFGLRYYLDEAIRTLQEEGVGELWNKVRAEFGRRFTFGGRAPYGAPKRPVKVLEEGILVPRMAIAHIMALSDVADLYPAMLRKRQWIQARRKRADREIFPLFGMTFALSFYDSRYHECLMDMVEACQLEELFGQSLEGQEEK